MTNSFMSIKTKENTLAHFQISLIAVVEEIPGSARTEGYLKLYTAGYHFILPLSAKEALQKQGIPISESTTVDSST